MKSSRFNRALVCVVLLLVSANGAVSLAQELPAKPVFPRATIKPETSTVSLSVATGVSPNPEMKSALVLSRKYLAPPMPFTHGGVNKEAGRLAKATYPNPNPTGIAGPPSTPVVVQAPAIPLGYASPGHVSPDDMATTPSEHSYDYGDVDGYSAPTAKLSWTEKVAKNFKKISDGIVSTSKQIASSAGSTFRKPKDRNPQCYHDLAMEAENQGHFDEAAVYYKRYVNENKMAGDSDTASGQNKGLAIPYYRLALLSQRAEKYQEANTYFRSALHHADVPTQAPIAVDYASFLLNRNEPQQAEVVLRDSLINHPQNETLLILLGKSLACQDKTVESLRLYSHVYGRERAYQEIAQLYRERNNFALARAIDGKRAEYLATLPAVPAKPVRSRQDQPLNLQATTGSSTDSIVTTSPTYFPKF